MNCKKIALGDNHNVRFSVIRKVFYLCPQGHTFLYHKRMEELIMTDYIDGNLKGRALEECESHLRSCPNCRGLAEELIAAGKLFRAVPRQEVPSGVWDKIRSEISAEPSRIRFAEGVFNQARYLLSHLKPAAVMAGAAILILLILTAARLMPLKDYPQTEPAKDDISMIFHGNDDANASKYGFGTPAEEYFL